MAGEGCCNTGPRPRELQSPLVCILVGFCPFPWVTLLPGMSLSQMAPVTGQAIAGLVRHTAGSWPSAACATEVRCLLLNSWSQCEWVYDPPKAFQCLVCNSKTLPLVLERKVLFKSCRGQGLHPLCYNRCSCWDQACRQTSSRSTTVCP